MEDLVVVTTVASGELDFISDVSMVSGNGLGVVRVRFTGLILGLRVSVVAVAASRLCGLKAEIILLPMFKSFGPVGLVEPMDRGESDSVSRLRHLPSPTRLIGL
jgi:hypothetical protein